MKKNETKHFELERYATLAGAFLASAGTADAAIVYTDVDPDIVVENGAFLIDMDGDGVTDFRLQHYGSATSFSSFASSNNSMALYGNSLANYGFVNPGSFYSLLADALPAGVMVGASSPITTNTWATVGFQFGFASSGYSYSYAYGKWDGKTDHYLGVQFEIAGATHYGWIRLDVDSGYARATVKDFAYEDVAGAALAMGDMGTGVSCSSAAPPTNVMSVNGASSVALSWDPIAGSVACQVKGTRFVPPGPSPSVNLFGPEPSGTNVPYAAAGGGTTWKWQVRCACSISPVDATAFSVSDTFSIDLPGKLASADIQAEVFPNPTSDRVNVQLSSVFAHDTRVSITDLTGRIVDWMVLPAHAFNIEMDLTRLESGMYFIQVGDMDAIPVEVTE